MHIIYFSFSTSHYCNYCNSVLSSAPTKVMNKIQHVRNASHVWSVSADAWRPAQAGYSSASAVQACRESPLLSSPRA